MTDLFSELTNDHRHLLRLCTELTGGTGLLEDTAAQRKSTSERLVTEAAQHEVAEERVLWPLVRRWVRDGDAVAAKALQQEAGANHLLYELQHSSAGTTEFVTVVRHLASALREHVTLEESQLFAPLRLQISEEESERLGVELAQARAAAPTRLHPDTGVAPAAPSTVGRVVAAIDRARDAVTRRRPGVSPEPRG